MCWTKSKSGTLIFVVISLRWCFFFRYVCLNRTTNKAKNYNTDDTVLAGRNDGPNRNRICNASTEPTNECYMKKKTSFGNVQDNLLSCSFF